MTKEEINDLIKLKEEQKAKREITEENKHEYIILCNYIEELYNKKSLIIEL